MIRLVGNGGTASYSNRLICRIKGGSGSVRLRHRLYLNTNSDFDLVGRIVMYKLSSEIFVFWTGSVRLGRRFYLNTNSEFDLIGRIGMYKLSGEIFVFWTNGYLNTILFYSSGFFDVLFVAKDDKPRL